MQRKILHTILGIIFSWTQIAYGSISTHSLIPIEGPIAVSINPTGITIFSTINDNSEDKTMVIEAYNLEDKSVGVNLYPFAHDNNILDWPLWNTYLGKNLLTSDIKLKEKAMEIIEKDPVIADIVNELNLKNSTLRFRCWVEPGKDTKVGISKNGVVLERLSLEVKVEAYIQGDSLLKDSFENRLAGLLKREILFGDEFSLLRRTISAYFLGQGLRHMVKTQPEFRFLFGKRIMILGDKISFWKRDFLPQYMDLYLRAGKLGVTGGIRLYSFPGCFPPLAMNVAQWVKKQWRKTREWIRDVKGSFRYTDIETAIISAFKASGLSQEKIIEEDLLNNAIYSSKQGKRNVRNIFLNVIKTLVDNKVISEEIGQELSWAIERIKEERLKDSGYEISYRLFSFVKEYKQLSDVKRNWLEKAFTNELAEMLLIAGVDPLIFEDEGYSVGEIKKRIDRKDLVEAGELLEKGIKDNGINIAPLELWKLLLRLNRHIKKSVIKRKHVHLVDVINVMAMFLNKRFNEMTQDQKMRDAIRGLYDTFSTLPDENKKSLIIGAILHDIGSINGVRDMDHYDVGEMLVKAFISDMGYSESLQKNISLIVKNHGVYDSLGSLSTLNDVNRLNEHQKKAVLLVHFFDAFRIKEKNRLTVQALDLFEELSSGNVDTLRSNEAFVVYRFGTSFQRIVSIDDRSQILNRGKTLLNLISNKGVTIDNEFFRRWAKVKINCRSIFPNLTDLYGNSEKKVRLLLKELGLELTPDIHSAMVSGSLFSSLVNLSTREKIVKGLFSTLDLEKIASLLAKLDSFVREEEKRGIEDITIDTDMDLMSMWSKDWDLLYKITTALFSLLENNQRIPITVFRNKKYKKAKIVIKVYDLMNNFSLDKNTQDKLKNFLTKGEVNPEEIALFLGNLSEVKRVLPVVLKEIGAEEGIVWDLVRYLISYKEEIFDRYGADVDEMKGKIQEQRLQDLLRECGLQEGLVEAMTNQDVETKREWFNNLVNILGLKGENISISMKQYDNAWKFLMDWAKDLSRIGVDFSSRLDENGELKKQIEGIYKAVLIGLIGEKVKIKDWVERTNINQNRRLSEKPQRGGIELVFQR